MTTHENIVHSPAITQNAPAAGSADGPLLPFRHLDTLWLQVTGTLCNLACLHCFISCGPKNDSHKMMSVKLVEDSIAEAFGLGVRDFYFTGGEPFLHPDIRKLIEITLAHGPLSILTNGVLLDAETCTWLREVFDRSPYSLDLRVSLDGTSPRENDPIRGRGSFDKILAGIRELARVGLSPVLTVTEVSPGTDESREAFRALLRANGIARPRVKFLAPFRIGREERRGGGYAEELLREGDLLESEFESLQCASARMVTERGVYPCPILIEYPDARMGDRLTDAVAPIRLRHAACVTCHVEGISCRT